MRSFAVGSKRLKRPRWPLRKWGRDPSKPGGKNGKWVNLGSYPTEEAAQAARLESAAEMTRGKGRLASP